LRSTIHAGRGEARLISPYFILRKPGLADWWRHFVGGLFGSLAPEELL
jgi:hypothetical protein